MAVSKTQYYSGFLSCTQYQHPYSTIKWVNMTLVPRVLMRDFNRLIRDMTIGRIIYWQK